MDRGGSLRFILLGIAGSFSWFMAMNKLTGGGGDGAASRSAASRTWSLRSAPEQSCDIWASAFHARVRSHGGYPHPVRADEREVPQEGRPLRRVDHAGSGG